nr:unnamed protein product [Callosobruchus analis]
MLLANKVIHLPDHIVAKYALPTNNVLSSHIFDLAAHQKSLTFKLAPKLSEEDLLPSHFSKMKVSTSTNVISHCVSSALKFLADELKKPEYLTTAWFLDQIEKWFSLMTSRHPTCALIKFNIDIYNETIIFLNDFLELFTIMEVGFKKLWKPSQTVSQFLKNPSSSSYDEDDREFISGFLDTFRQNKKAMMILKFPLKFQLQLLT